MSTLTWKRRVMGWSMYFLRRVSNIPYRICTVNMVVSPMVGMCHMCMWRLLVCKIDIAECMLHEVNIV